jgi:hypothetical protein
MLDRYRRDLTPDEEQAIRAFMDRLAQTRAQMGAVLQPNVIWLRGYLLRRWQAERRATIPLAVIEPVQVAAALAAIVLLLSWSLPLVVRTMMP